MPSYRFTARRRAILSATLLAIAAPSAAFAADSFPSKPIRFIVP
ncbi:MAG TPA: ABC transporter substrate-binding protein, partial [Cupriavidus sp.]|nr:ABC transporter substrate-binding protein [Cupriavidus sp.]